jgi:hypothetical protein
MMAFGSSREEDAVAPYQYEAIPPTSFRLLNLRPEGEDYGKIDTFSLDDAPPFAALSYTWGCPYSDPNYELENVEETKTFNSQYSSVRNGIIRCNGALVKVTRNSKEALDNIKTRYNKFVPMFDGTNYIWVDAICINQEDLDERAAQVMLMGRIYSSATRVFVWLGNSLAKTERALSLIQSLSEIPEEKYEKMMHLIPQPKDTYKKLGLETVSPRDWQIILSFLDRPWFLRVWVLQEYALARFKTVLCGQYRIAWLPLYFVSRMLLTTKWSRRLRDLELWAEIQELFDRKDEARSAIWEKYKPLRDRLIRGDDPSSFSIPASGPFVGTTLTQQFWQPKYLPNDGLADKLSLAQGVQMCRGRSATDSRDKVYALLHAINGRLEKLPAIGTIIPNYYPSNTVQHVYSDFTFRAIKADGSLEVLSLVNDIVFRNIPNMPSWALDLSHGQNPGPLPVHESWVAAASLSYFPPELTDSRYLHVRGAHIDEIIHSAIMFEPIDSGQVCSWLQLALQLKMPYHETDQGPTEVLWKVLFANPNEAGLDYPPSEDDGENFGFYLLARLRMPRSMDENERYSEERTQMYHNGIQLINDLKKLDPNGVLRFVEELETFSMIRGVPHGTDEQIKAVDSCCERGWLFSPLIFDQNLQRRVFSTMRNYLGLGPRSLLPGDEVWVLPSLKVPIILRRLPNGHFLVVGEAYIHGMMCGEAVSASTVLEDIILE